VGLALAAGLVSYAGVVRAAPQPTISQVTAQVSKLTTEEDRAVQLYDQVNVQLTAADRQLAQVSTEIAGDKKQFDAARAQVAQVAATAYEDGNMSSLAALLTSSDPQTILDRASFLIQLSSDRNTEMDQFSDAARQLSQAELAMQRAEAAIAALRDQRKSQASSIGKALTEKKSVLATLTAQQQATVEEQASVGSQGTTTGSYTGPTSTEADKAVEFAYDQLGCPYVYGGTGPCADGFDCSGLVQAAWAYAGVAIPRDTYEQWAALPHIPMSDIEPGDLIFFNDEGHVGMYVGDNDIIDAPQPGMDVEKVSLSESWYADNLDGAARP
jgi:peptidoglycan DL-endopeptidase CwlO